MPKTRALITTLAALGAALPLLPASAASLSCREIQSAVRHSREGFRKVGYESRYGKELKIAQLRITLNLATGEDHSRASEAEMNKAADGPKFYGFSIGKNYFQAVDIALGDNPFVYLFVPDTTTYSGISLQDGSLTVDGNYCEVNNIVTFR